MMICYISSASNLLLRQMYTSASVNDSMLVCIFKLCLCFLYVLSQLHSRRGTKKRLDSIAAAVPSTQDDDDKDEDGDGDDVHDVLLRHHERHHHHIVLEGCRGTKKGT